MKTHGMRLTRPFASRMVVLALLVVPHVAAPGACRPMAFGGSRRDIDEMSTCEVSSAETSAVLNTTAITTSLQPATMCWAQRRAWRRVFSTLEAGGVLSVVIIGGSVARGNGCAAEANARFGDEGHRLAVNCAYSARLVRWLRGRYPSARILYENRATGGMTTGGALLSLPSLARPVTIEGEGPGDSAARGPDASILLIDFALNDHYDSQVGRESDRTMHALPTRQVVDARFLDALALVLTRCMYSCARLILQVTYTRETRKESGVRDSSKLLGTLTKEEGVYLQVQASTESMIRFLLLTRGGGSGGEPAAAKPPALLMVESSCWLKHWPHTFRRNDTAAAAHRHVASHYGVPYFNFVDGLRNGIRPNGYPSFPGNDGKLFCAACIRPNTPPPRIRHGPQSNRSCASDATPLVFSDPRHPDFRGHEYLRAGLATAFTSLIRVASSSQPVLPLGSSKGPSLPLPRSSASFLSQHSICEQPASVYTAADGLARAASAGSTSAGSGRNVSVLSGDWRLYEDRPGKPGWIGAGDDGATIEFVVRFGQLPRLTIAYTLGYVGFAKVAVGFAPGRRHDGPRTCTPEARRLLGCRFIVVDGQRVDGENVTQASVIDLQLLNKIADKRLASNFETNQQGRWFSIKPHSQERLRIQLICSTSTAGATKTPCGKFKLLGLRTC